ncbi:MAG: hypothetical protein KI792_10835 [Alphaproteobacteria bacterium]|nr:hypothetical protein [Alphaproteobacteria bacterium SS10]
MAADPHHLTLQKLIAGGDAIKAIELAAELLADGGNLDGNQRAAVLHELGRAQTRLRNFDAAMMAFDQAIALDQAQPIYRLNHGIAAYGAGQLDLAASAFAEAVRQAPDFAYAIYWRGFVAAQQGDYAAADGFYRAASELQPDNPEIMLARLNLARRICDWAGLAQLRTAMAERWQQGQSLTLLEGLANPADTEDDALLATLSQARAEQLARGLTSPPFTDWPKAKAAGEGPLRIGYLSANFRKQAGGQLARGMFGAHDRDRVHVTAYALPPMDDSRYRQDPERDADRFFDLSQASSAEAAAQIRDDGIQVLIDMKGWTEFNRQDIMALRPAPVQIHYLGYAAPMVAPWINYQVVDPILVPEAARGQYPLNLIYLPDTYQMNDGAQPLPGETPERKAFGLPEDGLVLAVANTIYKVTQPVFEVWLRILAAREKTVLWMFGASQAAKDNMIAAAVQAGIDEGRLIFSPSMDRDGHLTRLQAADLALDTRPYGGHTTTGDCLWAGLPVLAMQGNHFASRVSQSLLSAAGLGQLVAQDADEFLNMATGLIDDGAARQALRDDLIARRHSMALFDTHARTHQLEDAYIAAWRNYCNGATPADIRVE